MRIQGRNVVGESGEGQIGRAVTQQTVIQFGMCKNNNSGGRPKRTVGNRKEGWSDSVLQPRVSIL